MTAPTPLRTAVRVLSFRASRDELLQLDRRHLGIGLIATWLVGMGRYWDSPRASFFQKAGLGSLVYVFVLTTFLWLILWPLRPKNWSWERLLTFVTLVSPPAALYAIPVEMFTRLETAQTLNASFLGIVAVWRVALLFWFLKRAAELPSYAVVIGSLLPLALIVTALTVLNLEHVMFDLMAGIRPEQRSVADTAYTILFLVTMISWVALPVLLIGYVVLAVVRGKAARSQRRFFPETWTLSWCKEPTERRIREAAVFGITEAELDQVMTWADGAFDSVFGAWDLFFKLDDARAAARSFLRNAPDLELWGVGLHRSLVSDFCRASAPPPPEAGRVYGTSATHRATCMSPSPLADGGTPLGHEILVASVGCTFNSPESLHIDEHELLRDAGVVPNANGLIDSLEDALGCCRLLEPTPTEARGESDLWLPWLIVQYAV